MASAQQEQAAPESPPRFEEVCFGDFDDRQPCPTPAELKKILGEVPGQPHEISEKTKRLSTGERRICHVSGLFRLGAAWQPDTTLRLSLLDAGLFQLHFWAGRRGVTFRYCPPAAKTWGAYGTTREGNGPRPSTFADWALDCGRYRRAGLGTVEVRYHNGNIVLTRGDLRLLSTPLPQLPTEVYLEGSGLVRGVSIYRSTGGPEPPQESPVVLRVPEPAKQPWQTKLPEGTALNKLPDGAVELWAGPGAAAAQAGFGIPGPGLYEYVFELQEPDVGTGIYLGREDGTQLARLAFYRDVTTGRTTFAYLGPESEETKLEFNFQRAMVPYAGKHQWVRLTLGGGVMKCFTTGDGVHWSQAIWSPLSVQGPVTQVGVYCIPTEQKRSIGLRSFELRRLDALTSLVPEEIQRRVGSLADAETLEEWDGRVAASRPAGVSSEVWQRACILRTLAENPYFSTGGVLIHRLLDGVLAEDRDLRSQLKLLDEAALLIHSLDDQSARPFQRHYERLGMRLAHAGHPDPLGVISKAVMRTPIWNYDRQNPWPDRLFRHELLARAAEDRWQEVDRLLGGLRYWVGRDLREGGRLPFSDEVRHLIDWAEYELARRKEKPPPAQPSSPPGSWRSPLIERLSKEGYNILGELQGAIDARAYGEACRVVAISANPDVSGLLPDAQDRRLLVSLPVAVRLAMVRAPALREAMREQFATLARLRLEKATAAGDPAAARAVCIRFCGTEAASDAHTWLGDRELSGGRAAQAVSHYRQAVPDAPAARHPGLNARLRLAGAMLGQDVGRPVTAAVQIGQLRVSAREFEQTVLQLRQARGRPLAVEDAPDGAAAGLRQCLLSGRCESRRWAGFEAGAIEMPRGMPESGADPAARLIAPVVVGQQMIVSSPGALAAFHLETGRQQWLSRRGSDNDKGHWPMGPMQPLVREGRIFVRRLTHEGPELACFDVENGRMIWSGRHADYVASDPLLIGEDLFAVCVGGEEGGGKNVWLRVAQFDPHTGRLRHEARLAEFLQPKDGRLECRAAAANGKIVVTVAGCVVCCDLSGQARWIRRQIWTAPPSKSIENATTWHRQRHSAPLVDSARVYATQPGVWNVECLDLQTGRLLWRKAVPELTALLGLVGELLIVETADGLLAKDVSSGHTVWHRDVEGRLEARLCGPELGLVYARLDRGDGSSEQPRLLLVGVDAKTGEVRASSVLEVQPRQEPLFGPVITAGRRTWAFYAAADAPAKREILELTPANEKKN